jgi:flavin-dependent dehydrogenase
MAMAAFVDTSLELDVAILGGGLAGNLLARQLRRSLPELRVGLFERSTSSSYKVGEATVEIAANYLVRRLGLSSYLYENQLPKNGLRYFFDAPSRSLPLHEMSEIGSHSLPFHPAFQLNRASLEEDLLELNQRDGVRVRRGVSVRAIELGKGGAPHHFELSDGRSVSRGRARWLVDAAGRRGLIAKLEQLRVREPSHAIGSVWGRFEDVVDVDSLGPESFRARVRHTPRRLSTIHFCYPGYWIWFIPLRGGLTSVGVTGDLVARRRELRTPEGFRAFLEEHGGARTLLAGAKLLDVGSYARIAYGTKRYFDADRWGLTGEAAQSSDPLYSPGSDFIALENDFLSDLIARDFAGEDAAALAERCDLYDRFMRFRHETTLLLYAGLYDGLGSFELAAAKWDFDIASYYNLWVSAYMCDRHFDLDFLREQLKLRPFVLNVMRNFAGLFRRVEGSLRERGDYFRANAGRFYCGLDGIGFMQRVGMDRSQAEVLAQAAETFNQVRAKALGLLGDASVPVEPLPLAAFLGPRGFS